MVFGDGERGWLVLENVRGLGLRRDVRRNFGDMASWQGVERVMPHDIGVAGLRAEEKEGQLVDARTRSGEAVDDWTEGGP